MCPQKLQEIAYASLVRSNLEYSSIVWDPHFQKDIDALQKIQCMAARFVTNNYLRDYSVTDMIHELNWQSLEDRRRDARLVMFFKTVNRLVAIDPSHYLTPGPSFTRSKNNKKYQQHKVYTSSYQYSFFPRTIPEWNKLPQTIIDTTTMDEFKENSASYTI